MKVRMEDIKVNKRKMILLEKDYLDSLKRNMKVVGKMYETMANELFLVTNYEITALRQFTEDLYKTLTLSTKVQWVDNEPYDYLGEGHLKMFEDYEKGFVKVPTGDDNSKLFEGMNLKFRATHDILHAITKKSFSYIDEVDVYAHTGHLFLLWTMSQSRRLDDKTQEMIVRMLRSEIVYQSAYKNQEGNNNINQKVLLMD